MFLLMNYPLRSVATPKIDSAFASKMTSVPHVTPQRSYPTMPMSPPYSPVRETFEVGFGDRDLKPSATSPSQSTKPPPLTQQEFQTTKKQPNPYAKRVKAEVNDASYALGFNPTSVECSESLKPEVVEEINTITLLANKEGRDTRSIRLYVEKVHRTNMSQQMILFRDFFGDRVKGVISGPFRYLDRLQPSSTVWLSHFDVSHPKNIPSGLKPSLITITGKSGVAVAKEKLEYGGFEKTLIADLSASGDNHYHDICAIVVEEASEITQQERGYIYWTCSVGIEDESGRIRLELTSENWPELNMARRKYKCNREVKIKRALYRKTFDMLQVYSWITDVEYVDADEVSI